MVIQVIENQALVWLGSMYAPLLPVFGLAANIISFYCKLMLAVWLHSPPKTRYSASRTSNLAYGLMLRTHPNSDARPSACFVMILGILLLSRFTLSLCSHVSARMPVNLLCIVMLS